MNIFKKGVIAVFVQLCFFQAVGNDFETTLSKAAGGDAQAQYNLACLYDNGVGVFKDEAAAVEWYRKAADQGNANAQCNLGVMYEHGTGILKDESQAAKWYRMAANQGSAFAQYNLGLLYDHGVGVLMDKTEAAKWYRMAADQGHVKAQALLVRIVGLRGELRGKQETTVSSQRSASIDVNARSEEVIGTSKGHRAIWTRYSAAVSTASKSKEDQDRKYSEYSQAASTLQTKLAEVEKQLEFYRQEIQIEPSIAKDEFEKSIEFENRKKILQRNRKQTIQEQLRILDYKRTDIETRLNRLQQAPSGFADSSPDSATIQPLSDQFFVPVLMGSYDADHELVGEFRVQSIIQYKESWGPPRVFKLTGSLRGVSLPPNIARQARESSEKAELFVLFHASPKPFSFSRQYSIPRSSSQIKEAVEKAEDRRSFLNGLVILSSGLVARALGHEDPLTVMDMTRENMRTQPSSNVETDDTFEALVIETGWSEPCNPERLYSWNAVTKEWSVLWQAP